MLEYPTSRHTDDHEQQAQDSSSVSLVILIEASICELKMRQMRVDNCDQTRWKESAVVVLFLFLNFVKPLRLL